MDVIMFESRSKFPFYFDNAIVDKIHYRTKHASIEYLMGFIETEYIESEKSY